MSSGLSQDKEKEHYNEQINRQKRIVFGERPTQISAQTLRSTARFNDIPDKSINPNQSGVNQSQIGTNTSNVSVVAQTHQIVGAQKSETKKRNKYILAQNSPIVTVFQLIISIVVVPNVLLSLFIMAFGTEQNQGMQTFLEFSEILFLIEIIQHFFTSYSDPEHYDTIDSLKKIAYRYIV